MKRFVKGLLLACLAVAVFFAPLLYAKWMYPATPPEEIAQADVALVFGALVRDGKISPLHEERLTAAIDLLERKKVAGIVVSNTREAALAMAGYLKDHGVRQAVIEIDDQAVKTPDTCVFEVNRRLNRRVIFVSQGFHIPRLSMLCSWDGLHGQALAAERYRALDAGQLPFWRVAQIRGGRHVREAALLWSALFGLYGDAV